jgi:hypothetical protein
VNVRIITSSTERFRTAQASQDDDEQHDHRDNEGNNGERTGVDGPHRSIGSVAKVEVTHGVTSALGAAVVAVIVQQRALINQQEQIMADLSGIQGAVAGLTSVVDAAGATLEQLAQTIRDTEPNQAALDDLANSIDAQRQELAQAIEAAGGGGPQINPT